MDKLELKEQVENQEQTLGKQILQHIDELETKLGIYQQYAEMHGDTTYKDVARRVRWYNE